MDITTFDLAYTTFYWALLLPGIMEIADVITGYASAWMKGEQRSSIMRKGLPRKMGEYALLLLAICFSRAFGLPDGAVYAVSLYIVVMETLSVAENLQAMGVPVPTWITKKAKQIVEELNKEKEDPEK